MAKDYYDGTEDLTIDDVRQVALKKLEDSFYGFSINEENSGEKAEGIAALYREVASDEANRKNSKWDIAWKVIGGLGTLAIAGVNLFGFLRATEKEKDEIYDTTTKQQSVRNFHSGRWWKK